MLDAFRILDTIKQKKPLVHHLTNWVTIYDCANITRSFGALPVMAHAKEEVEEMVSLASCLVLNIGTLTPDFIESMILAIEAANKKGIPVVLDVVGAGATKLRTDSSQQLISKIKKGIVKGNAGEIGIIAGVDAEVKGVESISVSGEPKEIARGLSKQTGLTVVITGKQDIVSDGEKTYLIDNGHEMMGAVVGTGCMATSVIGSFAAVSPDNLSKAAASALACYGVAGELAASKAGGPGTFKELFYDEVFTLSEKSINEKIKITEE